MLFEVLNAMFLHNVCLNVTSWAKVSCQSNYHYNKLCSCIEGQYEEGWLHFQRVPTRHVLVQKQKNFFKKYDILNIALISTCTYTIYPIYSDTLTLKMPRKHASQNVVCLCHLLNFLAKFQTYFCIQANSVDPDQTAPRLFAKMT